MPLYENIFIVRQDVSSTQVEAITDSFDKIITELGGKVAKREFWGLRTLAYRIKKNKKGHYVLLNIDAPSGVLNELTRQMRLHEDVLRELVIRLDVIPEEPSPIMLAKSDRERERPSHGSGNSGLGNTKVQNTVTETSVKDTTDSVTNTIVTENQTKQEAQIIGETEENAKSSKSDSEEKTANGSDDKPSLSTDTVEQKREKKKAKAPATKEPTKKINDDAKEKPASIEDTHKVKESEETS